MLSNEPLASAAAVTGNSEASVAPPTQSAFVGRRSDDQLGVQMMSGLHAGVGVSSNVPPHYSSASLADCGADVNSRQNTHSLRELERYVQSGLLKQNPTSTEAPDAENKHEILSSLKSPVAFSVPVSQIMNHDLPVQAPVFHVVSGQPPVARPLQVSNCQTIPAAGDAVQAASISSLATSTALTINESLKQLLLNPGASAFPSTLNPSAPAFPSTPNPAATAFPSTLNPTASALPSTLLLPNQLSGAMTTAQATSGLVTNAASQPYIILLPVQQGSQLHVASTGNTAAMSSTPRI